MATYSELDGFFRSIHSLESNYFRTKFEQELSKFKGKAGIGVISDTDAQPLLMNSHLGRFAIVTVAKINNLEEISVKLLEKNLPLSEFSSGKINPTELISLLIIQGRNFVEGIENVFRTVKGSCSMLLLTENGIIAARDAWGRTPLVVGKKQDAYAVASETTSFYNLGYDIEHYIGPGEIVRLSADGMEVLRKKGAGMQMCSFLWIYYGFPTSMYEGKNVEQMRNDTGRLMGETDDVQVDCVCGIPDWPRSFMPVNQATRDLVAKMKLIPNRSILEGRKVLFCDDSIVRGTQLRDSARMLRKIGAEQVHMRIACPPLIYACPFINFSASKSELELITRRVIADLEKAKEGGNGKPANLEAYSRAGSPEYEAMVAEIATRLGLDSLKFST